EVLLVENIEILHSGGDGMVLVFHAYGERPRLRVASEIAAEQLVIKAIRRIHRMRVVQGKETAAVLDKVPDGLLLLVGHPKCLRLAVSLRPVSPVAGDDEQRKLRQRFGIQSGRVFNKSNGDIFFYKSG